MGHTFYFVLVSSAVFGGCTMITLSLGTLIALMLLVFLLGAVSIPLTVYLFLKLPTRLYRIPAQKQINDNLSAG